MSAALEPGLERGPLPRIGEKVLKPTVGFVTSLGLSLLWGVTTAPGQAQQADAPPEQNRVVKPPPVPTGVIPLPQGPPPSGLQAPLPDPALPLPNGKQPLADSPNQQALAQYLKGRSVTINDAVAIALAVNRPLAVAVSGLYRAQGRTEEARAALNPTFNIGASIVQYDASTVASFGGTSLTIQNAFNATIGPRATLPIDISGSLHAAVSQSQFQEIAAKIEINRVRNQSVLDVKSAFYNVLRAQAQAGVAQDGLANALTRLNSAQKNYAAGTSPRFDVITAQRDVADAQQALIQAKSQVSLSLALLKSNMGVAIRTPMKITDAGAVETPPDTTPPTVPPTTTPPPKIGPGNDATPAPLRDTPDPQKAQTIGPDLARPTDPTGKPLTDTPLTGEVEDPINLGPDFDAISREALQTRPEILQADANIAAARKGIQIARRSSQPTLSAVLGYDYTPTSAGFTRVNQADIGLNLNVPIFDGGLSRARVHEAQGDIASAEISRRDAVDQIQVEVQQAYLTLIQARDRVAVANVGLAQAREASRLALVRYNAGVSQAVGVSPILELSTAQTSLTQAESNLVNALYDYNTARAQVDRAVGRYSYARTAPGYTKPPSIK
ncbi:MAG: outer membrane protein [Chthonomonadaceae bacterium]|nr:outer membrane protein [Chthonomonadaceae bacterium]